MNTLFLFVHVPQCKQRPELKRLQWGFTGTFSRTGWAETAFVFVC